MNTETTTALKPNTNDVVTYSAMTVELVLVAILNELDVYSESYVDAGTTRLNRPDPSKTGDAMVARIDVERAYESVYLTDQELNAIHYRCSDRIESWVAIGRLLGVSDKTAKAIFNGAIDKIMEYLNG
jgi:hypothetical protein